MGLNLTVVKFHYWLENMVSRPLQKEFKKRLESHLGQKIDFSKFDLVEFDSEYPRVGSYTAYGIFRDCLRFIATGDYEDQLQEDDDIEKKALLFFRERLSPGSAEIQYSSHILKTNDADTFFIPIMFNEPFEFYEEDYEIDIGSVPCVLIAIQSFAEALSFELYAEMDEEYPDERWNPISTAKNVARIMFIFFKKYESYCIAFA